MLWVSLFHAMSLLCGAVQHFELKALCHQYYHDGHSALTVLYFQQIPENTKLILCDWLWLSMSHCATTPFVRLVSYAQTKFPVTLGNIGLLCALTTRNIGISDFI